MEQARKAPKLWRYQFEAMRREAGTSGFPGDNPNWVKSILQASPELEGAASGGTVPQDYNYSRKTDEDKSLSSLQSIETGAGRQLHRKPKVIANDEIAATLAAHISNKKVSACIISLRIPCTLLSKRLSRSPSACISESLLPALLFWLTFLLHSSRMC